MPDFDAVSPPHARFSWKRFLLDKVLLAVIVFLSSHAANLWFEKQKEMNSYRLKDSDQITERVGALWKDISKLEADYTALYQAEHWSWMTKDMKNLPDSPKKNAEQLQQALNKRKDAVMHAITEDTHTIGLPMAKHLLVYIHAMDGYYNSKQELIDLRDPEAIKFRQEMMKELGSLMGEMRIDISAMRDYALRQVNK